MVKRQKGENPLTNSYRHRRQRGIKQTDFWHLFGITQSGGSRYEAGRPMPLPVAILMVLYDQGIVNDTQLMTARELAERAAAGDYRNGRQLKGQCKSYTACRQAHSINQCLSAGDR